MAAGGSTNPIRQQMINMMYLVLTALLALNVSADILKAFALVNKGLDKNNVSYAEKSSVTMARFGELLKVDKAATQKYYDNAVKAQAVSENMFSYLQSLKEIIAARSGGWVPGSDKATVDDDKNLEVSTHCFLNEGHGRKLQDSLRNYVKNMEACLDNPGAIPIKIDVEEPPVSKDGTKKDWISYYWEGVPSVAAITELTKLQNDVRNAEAEVASYNIRRVSDGDYKFGDVQAVISSETPVLSSGQSYEAKIFLGAISSTTIPKISVNGVPQQVTDGKVYFKEPATGGGTKSLNVSITVPNPKRPGHDTTYNTKTEYTVFTGASTIAAEKMNMLYIGLDNPVAVAAAGFTPAQTFVKFSGGGALHESGPGHYSFNPDGTAREVFATCYVRMTDGTTRQMGQPLKYRVRKVPKPEVLFGSKSGGLISKGEIATIHQLNAGLTETFAFEGLPVKVTSYTLAITPHTGGAPFMEPVQGNKLSARAEARLKDVHVGDMIIVGDVACSGPGINLKGVSGPVLTVK
jgi:gliding motility-associated protein GldM